MHPFGWFLSRHHTPIEPHEIRACLNDEPRLARPQTAFWGCSSWAYNSVKIWRWIASLSSRCGQEHHLLFIRKGARTFSCLHQQTINSFSSVRCRFARFCRVYWLGDWQTLSLVMILKRSTTHSVPRQSWPKQQLWSKFTCPSVKSLAFRRSYD